MSIELVRWYRNWTQENLGTSHDRSTASGSEERVDRTHHTVAYSDRFVQEILPISRQHGMVQYTEKPVEDGSTSWTLIILGTTRHTGRVPKVSVQFNSPPPPPPFEIEKLPIPAMSSDF